MSNLNTMASIVNQIMRQLREVDVILEKSGLEEALAEYSEILDEYFEYSSDSMKLALTCKFDAKNDQEVVQTFIDRCNKSIDKINNLRSSEDYEKIDGKLWKLGSLIQGLDNCDHRRQDIDVDVIEKLADHRRDTGRHLDYLYMHRLYNIEDHFIGG